MPTAGVPQAFVVLPVQAGCLRSNGFHLLFVPLNGDRRLNTARVRACAGGAASFGHFQPAGSGQTPEQIQKQDK